MSSTNDMESMEYTFPSPFEFQEREPVSLVELRMRRFSYLIRSKPDWWTKVHDPEIVAKWRQEMIHEDAEVVEELWGGEKRFEHGNGQKLWPRDPISDAQLDYIFDELKYEASRRDEATGIYATSIPAVYETRSLIPGHLKEQLIKAAAVLEDVPEEEKDWHPGSNKQVLDLVHPSLYCLRIGESCILDQADRSAHVLTADEYIKQRPDLMSCSASELSMAYQWLPTDFRVSLTGEVDALGYINNVHPEYHRELKDIVTSLLARFVPLFERVLSDVLSPPRPLAVKPNPGTWYSHVEADDPTSQERDDDDEDDDEAFDRRMDEYLRTKQWPLIPDPEPFTPPSEEGRIELNLKGRTLQVIFKLANIVLTPENPRYEGGAWHVEGMANERIVATGIYYYACDNITPSDLDFRQTVGKDNFGADMDYQNGDYKGWIAAYGLGPNLALSQVLWCIRAEEDKCVAFPNVYQHHVDGFQLEDPSRPGYRKILAFFLVDPFVRIHSTTDIPPQQRDWYADALAQVPIFQKLPKEIFDMILERVEGTLNRAGAEDHREYLMEERSAFIMEHNEQVFEMEFSMCEH
ncbi:hypothetical protein BN946_scf185008.g109 [Trametes cinnabarina]|uniref:Uncharacterized protein n=1 Tax=Pycnoporus cinnabarinus TaxID=5643 RepID=A0A060SGQ3_PYCCI|nr:hypothetical protein BN946_scf185008.g109 [Trametes cinnabarina]